MKFKHDDGGRAKAGYKGATGDCFVRAVSIASKKPYQEIYNKTNKISQRERTGKRKRGTSNARLGVYRFTADELLKELGFEWIPTMFIGSGCQVHLKENELPKGRLVVQVSKHYVAVIDGVIHDTHDPSREGTRCVYGYYKKVE